MKRWLALAGALCVALWMLGSPAKAQAPMWLCVEVPASAAQAGSAPYNCQYVSATNPLPITGSFSISGFRPVAFGAPITATTGGATGTLPTNTGEVVATNVGTTNGAYCALGGSATRSSQYIAPNGGWFAFAISGDTQVTCITSTSTTTINTAGGSGLPTGTGGGGGGGGSGCVGTSGTPCIVDTNASGNLIGAVEAGTATTGTAVPSSGIYV